MIIITYSERFSRRKTDMNDKFICRRETANRFVSQGCIYNSVKKVASIIAKHDI